MTVRIMQGESLAALRELPAATFDAVVTDPPYSSGGQFRGDRARAPEDKYRLRGSKTVDPDFAGDNRDQRAYLAWCALWMSECLRVSKPGALIMVFTDWRQLPTTSDAIQCGGWVWRGIVPWDKGDGARPMLGGFRSQCEYVVWGTRGASAGGPIATAPQGMFRATVKPGEKMHLAGKPIELMRELLAPLDRGSHVLDPFAGSGSTGVAAQGLGLDATLIEIEPAYVEIIEARLASGNVLRRGEAAQGVLPFGEPS